jgi:hypothetical protein
MVSVDVAPFERRLFGRLRERLQEAPGAPSTGSGCTFGRLPEPLGRLRARLRQAPGAMRVASMRPAPSSLLDGRSRGVGAVAGTSQVQGAGRRSE